MYVKLSSGTTCADPVGEGQGVRIPLENHESLGFLSNTSQDPIETHKTAKRASIQCQASIGPPVKRHLNGILLAGR